MAVTDPLLDTLFDGRYLISRKLGSGGMANVYLAEDQELGRRVAIKILDDRHASDDQFVERFRREAKNAAGLSHPNIVSIYDRGEAEGTYYIAMEYVEGRTLKELIVARGPSPIGIAIDYSRQILSALRFAHRSGIVHRDIKPHNVIVDGDGRVKVTDFGIARAGTSQMTEAGSIIGTAQYLSPEQARGAPVDQTSDLYSTGIVLYELLTGAVPFNGDTPVEIAMKHLSQTPEPPSTHRPEIPRDLDYVILRALAKDPSERYHSAEEMDADLERIGARARRLGRDRGGGDDRARAQPTCRRADDDPPRRRRPRTRRGRYYEYDETRAAALGLAVAAGGARARRSPPSAASSPTSRSRTSSARHEPVDRAGRRGDHRVAGRRPDRGGGTAGERAPRAELGQPIGIVAGRIRSRRTGSRRATSSRSSSRRASRRRACPDVVGRSRATRSWRSGTPSLTPDGRRDQLREADEHRDRAVARRPARASSRARPCGSTSRSGPKPIAVPSVVGVAYESAASQLQGLGFAVARDGRRVERARRDRGRPESRARARRAGKGSTITLQVSEGPTTSAIPDVTSQQADQARSQLEARLPGAASCPRTPTIRSRTGT